MSDEKGPKLLIIDSNSMTTKMVRGDVRKSNPQPPQRVVEFSPQQISSYSIRVAMNGGFSVELNYINGRPTDVVIFQTKEELMNALNNLIK